MASVVTPALVAERSQYMIILFWILRVLVVLSDIEEVNGTEPVRSTIMIPNVKRVMPRERAKYSSRTEDTLAKAIKRKCMAYLLLHELEGRVRLPS